MTRRQMHLIAYLKTGPTAQHTGGWRHPESTLDDILEPSRYEYIARLLESAKFDGCFFADLFGLYDIHDGSYDAYVRRGSKIPNLRYVGRHAEFKYWGMAETVNSAYRKSLEFDPV